MKGWKKIRGSNRYRSPSGRIVTRNEYDNARARRAGFRNYYHYRKTRKSDDFIRWSKDAIANNPKLTKRDFYLGGEFTSRYAAARKGGFSRDPEGSFADFLTYIGLREPDWDWDVGDTPRMEGSQ